MIFKKKHKSNEVEIKAQSEQFLKEQANEPKYAVEVFLFNELTPITIGPFEPTAHTWYNSDDGRWYNNLKTSLFFAQIQLSSIMNQYGYLTEDTFYPMHTIKRIMIVKV